MYTIQRKFERWDEWRRYAARLDEIPQGADRVLFYREKSSYRGISEYRHVTKLKARQVNQDFLQEISELRELVYLELDAITAEDLGPLSKLQSLVTLRLEGVHKARDFSPVLTLPSLRNFYIEHAKHLVDLEFLSNADHLESLGVEGSMWKTQWVHSLRPISRLRSLEALFMSSARLRDKNLTYLATIPNLKVFECARLAPKKNFLELRRLLPHLECSWCDEYEIHVS